MATEVAAKTRKLNAGPKFTRSILGKDLGEGIALPCAYTAS
jgi:hypothetical protein